MGGLGALRAGPVIDWAPVAYERKDVERLRSDLLAQSGEDPRVGLDYETSVAVLTELLASMDALRDSAARLSAAKTTIRRQDVGKHANKPL